MSVIELDSQDLKDLENGYMLKIKIGNHECGLVGPKWINAETRIQKFMKRQSVEDYAKERFEMFNYYKENERVNKTKDEYAYVTDEFILKKYDLDKYKTYKVVFHDDINYDVIGISIPTFPKEFTLFLHPGQYSYSYPNGPKNEPKDKPDLVNHPSHYETGKFECIDVMEEALGRDVVKGFCIGNAFKYLYRAKRKNGLEDLKKAQWYLNRIISMEDADNTKDSYIEQKERLKDLEDEILNETDKSERFV